MSNSIWIIDERRLWPPKLRPTRPFGVTAIEVMRSCPLRACFEESPGYERRMVFSGRIGTAFHKTVEDLNRLPLPSSTSDASSLAKTLFARHLAEQERIADQRPRERFLPRDDARINRALEATMGEAQRTAGRGSPPATLRSLGHPPSTGSEIPVTTKDLFIRGRVDRAEKIAGGTRIIDYKSALRPDLPERYERQLLLYGYMWHDTFGEWPQDAYVVYPLLATWHRVEIPPVRCQAAVDESRQLVEAVERTSRISALGQPGDVCKVCDFRPWCKTFWAFQGESSGRDVGLQSAYWGFEGQLEEIRRSADHFLLKIAWGRRVVTVMAECERFSHLDRAKPGWIVRALEWRLQGLRNSPRALSTPTSELFLVPSASSTL